MSVTAAVVNLAIALLLAPAFEGATRKIKAIIHSRKGPPVTQAYIDILKLLAKEDLRSSSSLIFRFAPSAALASFMVVALMTPMGVKGGVGLPGDLVTWIYFLTLGAAMIMIMAMASKNPFAGAGAGREMMMLLSVEPIVIAVLITSAIKSGSMRLTDRASWNLAHGPSFSMICAGIALLLVLQATLGRLPFDIAEAENEIVGGALVEQSGPNLALLKMALLIRQLVYSFLLVSVFAPWPPLSPWPLATLAALVKVLFLFVLAAVIEALSPRLRIDQAMSYMGKLLFVALAALAFAMIGV